MQTQSTFPRSRHLYWLMLLLATTLVGVLVFTHDASASEPDGTGTILYLPIVSKRFPPIPQAPTLSIAQQAGLVYDLSWTIPDPETIESYTLITSSDKEFTVTNTVNLTTTSYTVDFSLPNTPRYFRVVGVNQYGTSPDSNTVSIPLAAINISSSSVNADLGQCVTLSWAFTGTDRVGIRYAKGFSERDSPEAGSAEVCPSITTTYEVTAYYPDGSSDLRTVTVNVTGNACNRDPYVMQFNPTASQVNRNETITVTWDIRCATEVYLQVGADPEAFVEHQFQASYKIERSVFFAMRVLKIVDGTTVFEEPVGFGVTVRPDTRSVISD